MPAVKALTSGRYLSQDDRLTIADLRLVGAGVRQIARELVRAPSTISRELRRNCGRGVGPFRPHAAQKDADARTLSPKPGKPENVALVSAVEARLVKNGSSQQISQNMMRAFAGWQEM
ncbi:helix-turn-helix domain-containing protein [Sanguibacter antarcticus]|uniref:helix-turn-helix domain-containing protein n=1 Tax=Sanguibacter antarcticus TaxID=372484 RepID=UPI003CCBD362